MTRGQSAALRRTHERLERALALNANEALSWERRKKAARDAAHWAQCLGRLKRPRCCQCCGGRCDLTKHHPDYTRPLEIEWLCNVCHHAADARREAG